MQKLIKIVSLVILSAMWNSCKITSKNYDSSRQQIDALFGVWNFMEKTKNPMPESGLAPFPKTIIIESIGEDQGKLTLQLHSQSKTKIYPFSKTKPKETKSVQVYDNQDITHKETYSLEETATTFYSEGVLKVDLEWIKKTGETKSSIPGNYSFALDGKRLIFTRTNDKNLPEENRFQSVFKALYKRTSVTK